MTWGKENSEYNLASDLYDLNYLVTNFSFGNHPAEHDWNNEDAIYATIEHYSRARISPDEYFRINTNALNEEDKEIAWNTAETFTLLTGHTLILTDNLRPEGNPHETGLDFARIVFESVPPGTIRKGIEIAGFASISGTSAYSHEDWYPNATIEVVSDQHTGYKTSAYVHEIAHTLHVIDAQNTEIKNDPSFENQLFSTISYNSPFNSPRSIIYLERTPMIADILVIDLLWGLSDTILPDDTTFGLNSNTGMSYDVFFKEMAQPGSTAAMTIMDTHGYDTLDFSDHNATLHGQSLRINMNPYWTSDVYSTLGNFIIGPDTWIEAAIGGVSDDHITGNILDNFVNGNAGDDTILTGPGDDVLEGGPGNDVDGADNAVKGCKTGEWDTNAPDGYWHCRGSDDTITTDDALNCEAPTVVGRCSFIHDDGCATGTRFGNIDAKTWVCQGSDSGSSDDDEECFTGVCGYEDDPATGCQVGTYQHAAGDTWHCLGSDNSTTVDDERDCKPPRVIPGECGYSQIGACDVGDSSDPSGNTNPWICRGDHPDPAETMDDVDCEIGVCGSADNANSGCLAGNYSDIAGSTWQCLGNHPVVSNTDDDALDCDSGQCRMTCRTVAPFAIPVCAQVSPRYDDPRGLRGSFYTFDDPTDPTTPDCRRLGNDSYCQDTYSCVDPNACGVSCPTGNDGTLYFHGGSNRCKVSLGGYHQTGVTLGYVAPTAMSCDLPVCGNSPGACDVGVPLWGEGQQTLQQQWFCVSGGPGNYGASVSCQATENACYYACVNTPPDPLNPQDQYYLFGGCEDGSRIPRQDWLGTGWTPCVQAIESNYCSPVTPAANSNHLRHCCSEPGPCSIPDWGNF